MVKSLIFILSILSLSHPLMANELGGSMDLPKDKESAVKQKLVMGWLESVYLRPWNRRLTAKLDTGAKSSSVHADDIEHFSKEGEEWVRFKIGDIEDKRLPLITVERPLIRTVNIKCKGEDCQPSKRDVVKLTVCKNGKEYEAEFNLIDRSNFNYPVLLGRSFLKGVALVDSEQTFIYKGEQDICANTGLTK